MEEFIRKTYLFVKQHHSADCSGHDAAHITRVYENAILLLSKYPKADAFVVKMSALLHDVDDRKLGGNGHQTKDFLQTLPLSDNAIQTILDTIEAISFAKTGTKPELDTLEQKILFDADKLDALGAIGICRAILFGAYAQRPLFQEDVFPKAELSKQEYQDLSRKENTTINHFFDKLLKLHAIMQTEAGKIEAEKRHKFMVTFLTEFFTEQNLPEWLAYMKNFLNK
jgi:uncharacterized protein